ncbi:MAG: hypothetical protein K2K75_09295 [Muribaculaceae bacterium]|nr:hypothetical protein [Muribaculaceae bacterium]
MTDNTVLRTKSEENFPFYIIPDIDALAFERDPERLRHHRRRISANIGDPDALHAILGEASEDFQDFYGTSALPNLSTADTIDSFIKRFGGGVDDANEDEDPVVPLVAPAIDYASILEKEAEDDGYSADIPADATLGMIDAFLSQQPAQRIKPKREPKEEEKPSLTESFAKIMIKNGNYRRALEIFTEISLNNPEKSIYFADQIRFLKKVISLESL